MSETREWDDESAPDAPAAEPRRRTRRASRANSARVTSVADEFIDPDTGEPFRRHSQSSGDANPFHSVVQWFKPGWDYQWMPERVLNQPVDASEYTAAYRQGWRLVAPAEMPKAVPPGWSNPYIEMGAQRLYKRPMYLTKDARREQERVATEQLHDRFREAEMAPPGTLPRLQPQSQRRMEPLPADVRASLYEDEVQEV